jgi:hypothetical protein
VGDAAGLDVGAARVQRNAKRAQRILAGEDGEATSRGGHELSYGVRPKGQEGASAEMTGADTDISERAEKRGRELAAQYIWDKLGRRVVWSE